ncbi:cytosine permease [Mycolicibacterium septicum DSM 44393]|uniref:Cytosine permease n=1 Tax=Mycolicibacterium septicum DSM 44393 TaxID=1341646 RepID=A0A7X6ML85_9MYCO|nr:cytosine permease [Mycolicibacterium septicum]NKZ10817.1 cytosine permease [Mycolicibacterium septicum DSM 44393]
MAAIEQRSIDYIPESERHGTPRQLFTMWFSSNLQVTTLVVGTLGVAGGLNLFWSTVAILIGVGVGTVFMAAHSAQGPHLGIPQMIQSRAQFGIYGAGLPLLLVIVGYTLFTAANGVVMRDSVKAVTHLGDNASIILFSLITLVVAFVGYDLIHRIAAGMTVLSGVIFLIALVLVFIHGFPDSAWVPSEGFVGTGFLLAITGSASWAIGFGPYVADYSRYMPANTKTSSAFYWTYSGNMLGEVMVMFLGACLAVAFTDSTTNPGAAVAGLFGNWALAAYLIVILGVVLINVLNVYSAYMSTVTTFSGFGGQKVVSPGVKLILMSLVTILATGIAIATQDNFNTYFSDILIGQVYFLVPWSAINLCDFYLVRRGRYSVDEMFNPDGIYGRWGAGTLAIYALSFLAQIPFMSLSFYQGFIATQIGVDLAWIPGLIVPALLYYLYGNRYLVTDELILQNAHGLVPATDAHSVPVAHTHAMCEPGTLRREPGNLTEVDEDHTANPNALIAPSASDGVRES